MAYIIVYANIGHLEVAPNHCKSNLVVNEFVLNANSISYKYPLISFSLQFSNLFSSHAMPQR